MEEKENVIEVEEVKSENVCVPKKEEKGNFGWAVLGFFFPLVGFILFLVWKNDRKGDSKMAGIGALVGVCVNIAISILYTLVLAPVLLSWLEGMGLVLLA